VRAGKNHKFTVWKRETARKRALDQFDTWKIRYDFPEPFALTLSLEVNDNSRPGVTPLFHSGRELGPFCFHQEEFSHRKISYLAVFERPAKILLFAAFQPAFPNHNVGLD